MHTTDLLQELRMEPLMPCCCRKQMSKLRIATFLEMNRKTPLRSKSGFKHTFPSKTQKDAVAPILKRKKMSTVSKKQSKVNREYTKVKAEYLAEFSWCEACLKIRPLQSAFRVNRATDLHHVRGRGPKLTTDKRFFMALCRNCHDWIHQNGAKARELGLLAPIAEFGISPVE